MIKDLSDALFWPVLVFFVGLILGYAPRFHWAIFGDAMAPKPDFQLMVAGACWAFDAVLIGALMSAASHETTARTTRSRTTKYDRDSRYSHDGDRDDSPGDGVTQDML